MLAELEHILRDRQLLEDGEEPAWNINLISSEQATLQAFAPSGAYIHIRVKQRGVAPEEYERCCNAWRAYPRYAPRPLAQHLTGRWEIILVDGIPHSPVALGAIAKPPRGLVDQLVQFLSDSPSRKRPKAGVHRGFLQHVRQTTAEADAVATLDKWLTRDVLDNLPYIAQHGDFTVNNLGLSRNGMVVFDWEDFAKVGLPGFDLCTLIASDGALSPEKMANLTKGGNVPRSYERLLREVCPAVGLTPSLFRELVPLYLAVFLHLKMEYGEAVRIALRGLIRGLAQSLVRQQT